MRQHGTRSRGLPIRSAAKTLYALSNSDPSGARAARTGSEQRLSSLDPNLRYKFRLTDGNLRNIDTFCAEGESRPVRNYWTGPQLMLEIELQSTLQDTRRRRGDGVSERRAADIAVD